MWSSTSGLASAAATRLLPACNTLVCHASLTRLQARLPVCHSHAVQLLPNGGSSRQQASQPQGPPAPQPLQPPALQPLPPPAQPVASSASGLAALEAEAREVQRMLQEQQQLLGGGTSGGGWEGQEEGASSDSEGEWSQVVGKAAPKRGSSGSGSGTAAAAPRRPGSSRGSGGQHPITATPTSKLFVGHILGGVTVKDLEAVFSRLVDQMPGWHSTAA